MDKTPEQSLGTTQAELEYTTEECLQEPRTQVNLLQQTARQSVVAMSEYLAQRIQVISYELKDLEQTTSILMNQLIREKDHAIARRLQKEIGRLDTEHVQLNERLRAEKKRQQLYIP